MGNQGDISHTIIAKSDQLNAADLMGGGVTVKVLDVDVGKGDQPVVITIDGGNQPYKPCKGMLRLIAELWGKDSSVWVNRSMTLYCDPTARWAGKEVGGIRISHLSHIDGKKIVPIRASRTSVIHYDVLPLSSAEEAPVELPPYKDADIKKNKEAWTKLMTEDKSAFDIIGSLSKKFTLTQKQEEDILAMSPDQPLT